MAIAFIDIEGTVLDGDLSRGFISSGREQKMFGRVAMATAMGYLMLMKVAPATQKASLRWRALLRLVAGLTREQVMSTGRASLVAVRPNLKRPVQDRIAGHHAAGDTVVLLSGGMDEAAKVMAEEVGADRGEGTRCEIRNGRYSGKLASPICTGEHKATRAREVAAELGVSLADCAAYGDSASDIPLLSIVGKAVAVDPDPKLAAEAARRGWEVIATRAA